jgi:hypothetical protein
MSTSVRTRSRASSGVAPGAAGAAQPARNAEVAPERHGVTDEAASSLRPHLLVTWKREGARNAGPEPGTQRGLHRASYRHEAELLFERLRLDLEVAHRPAFEAAQDQLGVFSIG